MLAPAREAVTTPEAALICQTSWLASLSLPAFLYDDFGDLVVANTGATRLDSAHAEVHVGRAI